MKINDGKKYRIPIKDLADAKGASMAEVAAALGTSTTTVWNWNRDATHIRYFAARAVAAYFELSFDELFLEA